MALLIKMNFRLLLVVILIKILGHKCYNNVIQIKMAKFFLYFNYSRFHKQNLLNCCLKKWQMENL